MKYPFDISDFLEDIPSFLHSVVFLYFFVLIAEEGFLISSCYSLELCIQMLISFLFSFAFRFSSEFQRIARRDKKAFLSDQCKEIEDNNRMGKTRDLFKKIRDTKGTFHAKMG